MPTKRSPETELRHVKHELACAGKELVTLRQESANWKMRAESAQRQVAEWKERFDKLLARDMAITNKTKD